MALLIAEKIKILAKYSDFFDIFLEKKDFDFTKSNQIKLTHY